ncbi:hypothetical protein HID58_044550, partial [Brassica napus]
DFILTEFCRKETKTMMKLQGGLLQWSPSSLIPSINTAIRTTRLSISACVVERNHQLTARERRQLRNERRESKSGYSWREEVEERLIKKPKKRYASWTEELNLDTLADAGQQWWVVRVSRVRGHETAQVLARALARQFPEMEFTVYAPAVQVKRKLKNGSISVKPRPVFPGCIFIRCILNKEIHDAIREVEGVGGFIGSKVGNTKRQINKPRPVDDSDLEAIFKQAKEEQEKADSEFDEGKRAEEEASLALQKALASNSDGTETVESLAETKPERAPRKATLATETKAKKKKLAAGSTVRVLSGTFAEFVGNLKKLNRKTAKATVGFTLFGKETLVEIDINELVPEIQRTRVLATMVKATKAEKKIAYDAKLCQLIDEFTQILVVAADNVGSTQLQNIRKGLRGDSVVLMGKNTMMKRSVKIHAENTGNASILNLMPLLQGNVGLIFTKGDLKEVSEEVAKYKVGAPARVGLVAPIDVVVQPGNTGLDPSQTSFFQVLNIPTKINKGTVEIITPNALAISVATEYTFPQAEKVKEFLK